MNVNGNIIVPARLGATSDRRTASAGVSESSGAIMAETFPRYAIEAGSAPSANKVYIARIKLVPGSYTTATVLCIAAATGVANAFVGLYDVTTLAKLAGSADQSTAVNASVANTHLDLTLSYAVTSAADYYLALCLGTPSTLTLARGMVGATDVGSLAPILHDRHNATVTNGALPDPLVLEGGVTGKTHFWVRYA